MSLPDQTAQKLKKAGVSDFRYFESIGSTNLASMDWLNQNAPDQAVVFADHQSAGRGRLKRKWVTNPGSALAVSVILRPSPAEQENLSLFSPLAGVALTHLLETSYQIPAEIKWPNDVLIDEGKTAGILTELSWENGKLKGIVIGTGINITPLSLPPAEALQYPATCLQNHSKAPIERLRFLAQFLQSLFQWRKKLNQPEFFDYWQNKLAFRGKKVYIKGNKGEVLCTGQIYGILKNGDLQIATADQKIETFTVGDVHLRRDPH